MRIVKSLYPTSEFRPHFLVTRLTNSCTTVVTAGCFACDLRSNFHCLLYLFMQPWSFKAAVYPGGEANTSQKRLDGSLAFSIPYMHLSLGITDL